VSQNKNRYQTAKLSRTKVKTRFLALPVIGTVAYAYTCVWLPDYHFLYCSTNYKNWSMNVEDIASKISYFRYTAWLKRPNFWVHVSPDSAETLAREGGITNHHLIAYSLSNILCKKLSKSVHMRWSYSVLHHCRYFETQHIGRTAVEL